MHARRLAAALAFSVPLFTVARDASADLIRVIDAGVAGNVGVVSAIAHLAALGHTVSTGGTLPDYTAYDQVWDLRYQTNFVLADLTAFSGYLASGGRVYFTGENPTFDALRNTSLRALLFALGAGDVMYDSSVASNTQTFTAEGGVLNAPNAFSSIAYIGARSIDDPGNGFLVTEGAAGIGSMVAWDFGDIDGASDARMVALWDIDIFRSTVPNGVGWVENIASFLAAEAPADPPGGTIPVPGTPLLLALGLGALAAASRRRGA